MNVHINVCILAGMSAHVCKSLFRCTCLQKCAYVGRHECVPLLLCRFLILLYYEVVGRFSETELLLN